MEITAETVLERVRGAGGYLRLDGLDPEELAAWRRASKVLRLLRAGHERLSRYGGAGTLNLVLTRTDITPPDTPGPETARPAATPTGASPAVSSGSWELAVPRTQEFLGRVVRVPTKIRTPDPLLEELEDGLDAPERSMRNRWGSS